MKDGARALVEALRLREGLLRITVTPPSEEARLPGTVAVTARDLPTIPPEIVLRVAESVIRVPGPLSRCKTNSRIVEATALREARRHGAFDAILRNVAGNVVETSGRNLFVAVGGALRTPSISEGALEGITRAAVLELARIDDLTAKETVVTMDALLRADEVFLTGSGVGVLAVHRVHARTFVPTPGPLTARLAAAYERILGRESSW